MNSTGNDLESNDILDFSDNCVNLDTLMNSDEDYWEDRFGNKRPTIDYALRMAGFTPAGFDFTTGGVLQPGDRNKCVFNQGDQTWYSYTGNLPYNVIAGSTPGEGWNIADRNIILYPSRLQYLGIPIGAELPLDIAPPTDDDTFRFIKLTADDPYNSGVLSNKVISGTAPNLVVKMEITDLKSPLNGQLVFMLNTMGAIPTPGINNGAIIQDAMRNLTGSAQSFYISGNQGSTGVMGHFQFGPTPAKLGTAGADPGANYGVNFDASRQVPVADRFQPFGVSKVFYKRIY